METFGHEVVGAAQAGRQSRGMDMEKFRPIQGAHILLAEDNLINQQVASEFLEQAKFIVDIANDGQEALDKLSQASYDCVLMDIQMPVMDGYTATREIRKQDKYKDLELAIKQGQLIKQLSRQVSGFEFEEALQIVTKLRQMLVA